MIEELKVLIVLFSMISIFFLIVFAFDSQISKWIECFIQWQIDKETKKQDKLSAKQKDLDFCKWSEDIHCGIGRKCECCTKIDSLRGE